jgi:hypothetical protein
MILWPVVTAGRGEKYFCKYLLNICLYLFLKFTVFYRYMKIYGDNIRIYYYQYTVHWYLTGVCKVSEHAFLRMLKQFRLDLFIQGNLTDCVCVCVFVSLDVIRCNSGPLQLQWIGRRGRTKRNFSYTVVGQVNGNNGNVYWLLAKPWCCQLHPELRTWNATNKFNFIW